MRIPAYTTDPISIRKIISSTLALAVGMALLGLEPGFGQPQKQLHRPTSLPSPQPALAASYEEDTLLLMPTANADKNEVNDAIKKVHGSILTANIRAGLPSDDSDLAFSLCSLAAPVEGSISPARAILAAAYRALPDQQLPSAVRVELALPVSTELGVEAQAQLKTVGCAATCGAAPPT